MKAACITGQPGMTREHISYAVHTQLRNLQLDCAKRLEYVTDCHSQDIREKFGKQWHKRSALVCTFNLFALDQFEYARVLICVGDGFVCLNTHKFANNFRESMLSGELWSFVNPEEWLELPRLTDAELLEFFTM
jgi:hypothetical protein